MLILFSGDLSRSDVRTENPNAASLNKNNNIIEQTETRSVGYMETVVRTQNALVFSCTQIAYALVTAGPVKLPVFP